MILKINLIYKIFNWESEKICTVFSNMIDEIFMMNGNYL